jgi:AraC-like DNA-binding protein
MTSDPTLPFESLEKLLQAAEERGVGREALLAASGLSAAGMRAGLRFHELAAVYEHAARLTGDDAFGLHVGERTTARMYGLPGYLLVNARTLGEALKNMIAFQRLWSQAAAFHVEPESGGGVRLRYWHAGLVPAEGRRQESEQMLSAIVEIVREALAERISPLEVRFEHAAPAQTAEHARIFGCRLRFGAAATEVVLPRALVERQLPKADPALGAFVRRQAEAELAAAPSGEPFLQSLQLLVRAAILGSGDTTLAGLAAAVGTGPRTLQRRLNEQGLTHRGLIERERVEIARRLLADSRQTLGAIAFRLGYSQPSAFHRAFRRSAGMTPGEYRSAALSRRGRT